MPNESERRPPVEGRDYYFENGLLVMTERFHLDRGYCCGNACRHCPYEHEAVPKGQSNHTAISSGTD
ncbi:MAG TPA: DUF5522 domain-containing protein [Pyrinomonadaceae bacterium]|nr:DUF5522 domain-containing protein [Pyrinomonadaceae bacterium]